MRLKIFILTLLMTIGSHAQNYIVVDFTRPSSEFRFTVYNEKGECVLKSKCAHGAGGKSTASKPEFSNRIGSRCSCLGKFEIVEHYHKNGMDYLRLKGLDKTNSNALARGICIHGNKLVTRFKYIPFFNIPLSNKISEGCFSIDYDVMYELVKMFKEKKLKYLYAANTTS